MVVRCRHRRLDARVAAGRVLLGVRVHAEAAEGDASPCGYEPMLKLEALLSVGVDATCRLPTACSCSTLASRLAVCCSLYVSTPRLQRATLHRAAMS